MNTVLIILIVIISVLVFVVLVSYIVVLYATYKIKKKAEEYMVNKGMGILNKGIDTGVSKFQQKINETIAKKNKKNS